MSSPSFLHQTSILYSAQRFPYIPETKPKIFPIPKPSGALNALRNIFNSHLLISTNLAVSQQQRIITPSHTKKRAAHGHLEKSLPKDFKSKNPYSTDTSP